MHSTDMLKVLLLVTGFSACFALPSVRLQQGLVQGTYKKSYDGKTFSSFEGIPYAKPPVGNLRFKEPIDAPCWSGTLIANKSYICPQLDETQSVIGTEDCLYIYVDVPKENIDENDNFDVVVHIHGGSLLFGSPYTMVLPDYLMDKNLIVVSFNYRLGAAGFLSTADEVVFGNNGLKDQTLALKWIKNNIKKFGGNPESITITGFSSGGLSVHHHYLSPLSRGLFHKGYASSSVATNPVGVTLIPLEKTKQLAQIVQCPLENNRRMVECLRKITIEDLVKASIWFRPVVEKNNPRAFISEYPYKLLKDKKISTAPFVISNTINESLFSLDSLYKNPREIFTICNNFTEWGKVWLDLDGYVDDDKMESTLNVLKKNYLDNCNLNENNGLEKINRLMTHRHFHVGTDLALRTHAAARKSKVYFYLSKFIPDDRLEFFGPPAASHGVDSKLLFKFRTNPDRLNHESEKMMKLFVDFLYNYAKTGIPKIGNVKWEPINPDKSSLNVLEIDSPENIKMTIVEELVPRSLWRSLPIKENENLL